jgi:DNA repair exonuclease SbcCD nuclease subunit
VLSEDDYIIVLGDFGVCWDGGKDDAKTRAFWRKQNCNVLFIDGNHENFDRLNSYAVGERFGGKVRELGDRITHLMRGQVYEIEGKTFFTMGGAASTDCGAPMDIIIQKHLGDYFTHDFKASFDALLKYDKRVCRVPGKSWWAGEIPSPDEIAEAKANLAAHGNKVDYILTHTPSSRVHRHFGFDPRERPWGEPLIAFLDWLEDNVEFEHWWFGHLHHDFYYDSRHIGLYDGIREVL